MKHVFPSLPFPHEFHDVISCLQCRMGSSHGDDIKNLCHSQQRFLILQDSNLSLPLNLENSPQMAGFPGGASDKETACQCRKCKRHRCDPWVWKIPWSRKWQPTPVYLPRKIIWAEEPGGLQCMGLKNQMQLSTPLLDIDSMIMLPNNFCYSKHLNMFNVMRIV